MDWGGTGTCKTPVFWRLARLGKRLDLGSAKRNATPQAPCTELHGRYRRPKELRRIAKNPRKTRVFERRGQEPNFFMFPLIFTSRLEILRPNAYADPASNEPLRISLGIVTKNGAGVDRVSKMLAEPLVLRRNSIDRSGDRIRDVFANPL